MPMTKSSMTRIDSIRHSDKRANIPTEELRDFVADDEETPKTLLYPRDPSLDPQLVWQGKDEQDSQDLAVPAVPIYIQEKIHPQAIINDLLAQAARLGPELREQAATYQLNLFADFNGGPEEFDQKVEFYQHEQNWANRLILGDSLLVMASLAEKEGLRGKVQMIYLDPPYGIKFGSNWQVSTRKRDVKDGKAEDATRQPEQVRAFRDTWKLGIHSYLAYLRDRLVVARELLTETGSVFVQIGDENVHLVRNVLDEVLGSENFIALITVQKTGGTSGQFLKSVSDYVAWYAKDLGTVKYRQLYIEKASGDESNPGRRYDQVQLADGSTRPLNSEERGDPSVVPAGARQYQLTDLTSNTGGGISSQAYEFNGVDYTPPYGRGWATNVAGRERLRIADRIVSTGKRLMFKRFLDDYPAYAISNIWRDAAVTPEVIYVVQTHPTIIQRCLLMTTDPGDLVLDPTCGSGTTAYVAEQWGRRWITCDTSRVALALARTRLMSARYPYYLLTDSPEGVKKEMELSARSGDFSRTFGETTKVVTTRMKEMELDSRSGDFSRSFGKTTKVVTTWGMGDIRKGFVYRRVPHVTLKSIANNPDIREGMTRAEIDAAIARHADIETLYDQPYEEAKRVRVCGPFSVESLSPHRVLSTDDADSTDKDRRQPTSSAGDFVTMILDNLKKAGVQNTRKAERLTFDRLDPYPGVWLHATGEYTEKSAEVSETSALSTELAKVRRVAVSIGPEHGTVGPQQVKEAAKEAVQGVGFDLLVVCGFAFDPHVSEEVKRYGKLIVLPARMNPDLAMGDELLKKTGAGNLFMVFGEPDVDITRQTDGQVSVAIKGVDVYLERA